MNVFSKTSSRGHQIVVSKDDVRTTIEALTDGTRLTFRAANPKRPGTAAHDRFAQYSKATTVAEYLSLGGTKGDFEYDLARGFVKAE